MKKLVLGLFIAFGISACSLSNDDLNVDCGTAVDSPFTGFPLLCNYSVKTLQNNAHAVYITSQAEMDKEFTKHANTCPVASDPVIDFSKYNLVAIYAGVKPSSGYEIKIASIVENNCQILLNFFEKSPQAGEEFTQTPTYPSDFILIPKSSKPLIFNKIQDSPNNIVIGSFATMCTGSDCQKFFQLNDYSILKFLNVGYGSYTFDQYKYTSTTKTGEYTAFLKTVPAEILNLKGQTKTYGSPDDADQGGIYFQLRQAGTLTKVYIDNKDTDDQSAAIKAFKKTIQDKIASLK
jgi:protease stability complex PrcB-like protein